MEMVDVECSGVTQVTVGRVLGCLEQSKIPVPPCPLPASLVAHLVHGTESYIKPGQ